MSAFLAIETSQSHGGLALRGPDGTVDVEALRPAARHDDDLMPALVRLMARRGLRPAELEALGVSIGPGGFTGLRIAVSTAKMLGEVLRIDLLAVPTALVVAEAWGAASGGAGPIISALAVKDQTFWCTRLQRDGGGWSVVEDGRIVEANSFDPAGVQVVLADEHFPDLARARCEAACVPIVAPSFDPRACLVAAEHWRALRRTTDALSLQPLYPRAPEAVRVFEKASAVR